LVLAVVSKDCVSIFRAELYAVSIAVGVIHHSKDSKVYYFFQTRSRELEFTLELDLVQKIIKDCTQLVNGVKQ